MNTDELYSKIHQNNEISIQEYWNKIQPLLNVELSDNFKKLYLKMVAFEPDERPQNIDEILNSDWMKEIGDMATLEEELKKKFEEIFEKLKSQNKEVKLQYVQSLGLTTRSATVENEKSGKTPKKIPNDRININHYIIINGDLEVNKFMNSLIQDIKSEFAITQISIRDVEEYEYLQLELSFYDSEENSEDKFVSNEEEEEEEEEIDNDIKCSMEIELFQYDDGRYLLEFLRKKGGIHQYNKNFFEIRKIIEEKTLEPYIA
jgi:serine/threonine protein kinase